MDSAQKSPEAMRRSTRIRAQLPLRLTSLDPEIRFSEQCHTLVINTQGCGVRVSRALEVGLPAQIELASGRKAAVRVANAVPLGTDGKYFLVGLALEEPGNIWGIHPVPADWGEPEPVNASAGVALPGKKNEWPFSQFSRRGEFHPGRR